MKRSALLSDVEHGNKTENYPLTKLESGQIKILVVTDVAARGIDTKWVTHVISYRIPQTTDGYIHVQFN